jgi:hypothetical protein
MRGPPRVSLTPFGQLIENGVLPPTVAGKILNVYRVLGAYEVEMRAGYLDDIRIGVKVVRFPMSWGLTSPQAIAYLCMEAPN